MNHVLILLFSELLFSSFKLWLLCLDNKGQQLILETTLRHNEVDYRALSSSLWLVVWIDKLSLQEEFEATNDLNLLRTESYVLGIALLYKLTRKKRVQDSIDVLAD